MNIPGFTAGSSLYRSSGNYTKQMQGRQHGVPKVGPQLPPRGPGGSSDCIGDYQNCYVDCSVRYPESRDSPGNLNAQMRQGCFDSCDAAYNLCGGAGSGGGSDLGLGLERL